MIIKFKLFENITPEVGDYVIIQIAPVGGSNFSKLNKTLMVNVGNIALQAEPIKRKGKIQVDRFQIDYPDNLNTSNEWVFMEWFEEIDNGYRFTRWVSPNEIIFCSKSRKELEAKIAQSRFDL